jgi:RNA polymerase sigma-70 factor (ECF subfamily)
MQAGDDAKLVKRILEHRDDAAFTQLYRRYAPVVLGLAFRMLKDRGEADEVLQQVFMKLWDQAGDYDPGRGSLPVWLAVIARSRCLDRLRGRQRRLKHEQPFAEVPEWLNTDKVGALDHLQWKEQRQALLQALGRLRPAQSEAIQAAYFDGQSREEIARRMGLPVGTVKTHLKRGLVKMLSFLNSAAGDPR